MLAPAVVLQVRDEHDPSAADDNLVPRDGFRVYGPLRRRGWRKVPRKDEEEKVR